ncbi:MAG: STAS domain-containing protein, partial [Holophagales bacterium]|nr:STAS domain-containing protein [Holophagales bacterium]
MTKKTNGDVLILYPEGKITFGDGDQELGEAVRTELERGVRKIVIDFSKVSYLDSSGVGELVGCYTS